MVTRSNSPLADYDRQDAEDAAFLAKCPICDVCGEPITEDMYCKVGNMIVHEGCIEYHSLDSFIDE